MSTYQYYEFQAVDRPLSDAEQAYVETLSSRVELTPHQASFTHHYGSFRGDPEALLDRCFDMMLYIANWGTQRLIFRLPKALVNLDQLRAYELAYGIVIDETEQSVLVEIRVNDEDGFGWTEGEGTLPQLLSLREALLNGDYRALYLGWLAAATISDDVAADVDSILEPPVPANLAQLTPSLNVLIDWLRLDPDLVAVAALKSPEVKTTKPPLADWVAQLSGLEKTRYLVRVVEGDPNVGRELRLTLKERFSEVTVALGAGARLLSELLAQAEGYGAERAKQEAEKAQQARIAHLKTLIPKKEYLWDWAVQLIEKKQAQPYAEAVTILVDLKDLAEYENQQVVFSERFEQLCLTYQRRSGLMRRMREAKLLN